MIGGFNLVGFNSSSSMTELASQDSSIVKRTLDYNKKLKSVIVDEKIDAEALQDEIFPVQSADVFISHSHGDEGLAIRLKNWLKRKWDMDSFLDGEIWRSADDILKVIDKKSCWKDDRGVYDYNERNLTTSYVHVMLCNAIMQAMNSCDFVFFLNTPSSIDPYSAWEKPKTYSPWLYYELSVLKYIQKEPARIIKSASTGRENFNENLNTLISYPAIDLTELPKLEFIDLKNLSPSDRLTMHEYLLSKLGHHHI